MSMKQYFGIILFQLEKSQVRFVFIFYLFIFNLFINFNDFFFWRTFYEVHMNRDKL